MFYKLLPYTISRLQQVIFWKMVFIEQTGKFILANNFFRKVNNFCNIDSDFFGEVSKSIVSTVDFNIISENNGSLGAENSSNKRFERVHLNLSSNSVENVTGYTQFKNTLSSALEKMIDVNVSHTSGSCNLSHQPKFLNISSKLTNILMQKLTCRKFSRQIDVRSCEHQLNTK